MAESTTKKTVSKPRITISKKKVTVSDSDTVEALSAKPASVKPALESVKPASVKPESVKPESVKPAYNAPLSPQMYSTEPQFAADLAAASVKPAYNAPVSPQMYSTEPQYAADLASARASAAPQTHVSVVHQTNASARPKSKEAPNANELNNLLKLYLSNVTKEVANEELEFEVKFGTIGVKSITRINYDNIIKKLLSSGFTIDANVYLLRIQNEYRDQRTGRVSQSNIRTEINGLQNIRLYCQSNKLDALEPSSIAYIQKSPFTNDRSINTAVSVNDFNFRAMFSKEKRLEKNSPLVKTMLDNWVDQKKTFRYLNRFKLKHPSLPVIVDMSIVKDSRKQGRFYVPEYNIHDAGVFTALEKYEVEIETINQLVGIGTPFHTAENLNTQVLKPVIKYVLAGMQETNYPISYPEQTAVMQDYMKLLWGNEHASNITPANFVGPSSYTLEMKNIKPLNKDSSAPNIRDNYTVTDKADGERKLLFISPNGGRIYLINTNMDFQFTGTLAKNPEVWNTLIDGEHVLYDKKKKFINMYAAFDLYYINGKDIRANAFVSTNPEELDEKYRLPMLEAIVKKIRAVSVVGEGAPLPLKITNKRFYVGTDTQSIFQGCTFILSKEHDGLFEYETDGLIFTPANRGVGSDKIGEYIKPIKTTWEYSFKWKPAKFNTIDFMVSTKKNENGTDLIGSTFQDGLDASSSMQIPEYKTVILRVGFDEAKHGYVNPYQDVIDDKIPTAEEKLTYKSKYVPMQFFPTEPSDYKAGICNLLLTGNAGLEKNMYTENNEIIEDNTIVEFRYDMTRPDQWRWVPLRVRYDKTAQLRSGEQNFGNAFHVANSNWHSIHNPITQMMMMTGENIPEELGDDDVYYNKVAGTTKTRALRDFHNVFIKTSLIRSVAKPGNTLIDLAVGKGGDWPKWIDARLKFVFGVDISRDNIQNRLDGACARYLTYRKKYRVMPAALFVNGNSSVNIKKTTGILIDKDKQITRAVFGQGPKDAKILGQGVYKQYGVAADGFDVCSIQFAIHYMFENQETLQNFLQNVSEVTKEGGYFIGTSYDGELLFNMLRKLPEGESKVIMSPNNQKKIWELVKRYDRADYNADETCVGYAVDVFQESINKTVREYLVNYTYLTRILENYGFVLVNGEELKKLNSSLTSGTGLFSDLFHKMNEEIKNNPRAKTMYGEAPYMTDGERTISFLNRYFIYKKVRKVNDAEKVALSLQHKTVEEARDEKRESAAAVSAVAKTLAAGPASLGPASLGPASLVGPAAKKSITVKRKLPQAAKPVLSVVAEEVESVTAAASVAAAQTSAAAAAADAQAASTIQALSQPPVQKKTVVKLKRAIKL